MVKCIFAVIVKNLLYMYVLQFPKKHLFEIYKKIDRASLSLSLNDISVNYLRLNVDV